MLENPSYVGRIGVPEEDCTTRNVVRCRVQLPAALELDARLPIAVTVTRWLRARPK